MQVIGICRFSYPAIGGFQVEHESPAERAAYLYAPDRMNDRFRYFQAFTLPALRAQTDPDFTFLVVVGDDLPAPYLARLEDLTRDLPQVRIRADPPGPHRQVMKQAIQAVRRPAEPSLEFRLDDDDAVGVDFVATLRAEAQARQDALTGHRHIALDFPNGFIAMPGPEGIRAKPTRKPFMTAGLAVAFEADMPVTIMNFSHVKLGRFMQVVSIDSPPMYVRGHNRWNDSRQAEGIEPEDLRPLTPQDEDLFRTRFNIDADHVAGVFSD